MLKVKDGYAKLYGNSQTGNVTLILLSNGSTISTDTFANKSHTHVWTDITNRPTVVSAFTNDAGYLKSHLVLDHILSTDVRNTITSPTTYPKGIYPIFLSNTTNGLNDGGTYSGVINWRSYGIGTDLSGGYPMLIAYTAAGNLWTRMGASSTAWNNWRKLAYFDLIPTSIGDLSDNGVFVKKAGDTMTGSLILVSNAYNLFGTNINIGSFAANTITTKAFSGTSIRLRFLTETSAVGNLIIESSNITTTNTLNVSNNLTITGDTPKLTFATTSTTVGFLTMPSSSTLYRNTSSTAVKILDAANSYVNTSGYGYINNSLITRVSTATSAYNLIGTTSTDLDTFIKSTSTKVIYTDSTAKNTPVASSYHTTLHIGAALGDNEVLLSINTINDDMYFRVGDNSASWDSWRTILTNVNYTSYIDSIKGKFIYDLNSPSYFGTDAIKLVYEVFNKSASNLPDTNIAIPDNANSIITMYKSKYGASSSYATQLAFGDNSNALYTRSATNGKWQSWATILTSTNWNTAVSMYWANIKVLSSSSTTTMPQFSNLGLGTPANSSYSIIASDLIKAPSLLIGNSINNSRIYVADTTNGMPSITASSATNTTQTKNETFTFEEGVGRASKIPSVLVKEDGLSITGGYTDTDGTVYNVSWYKLGGRIYIACDRMPTMAITGSTGYPKKTISVQVTYTQIVNGSYALNGGLLGSYLRAGTSVAALGVSTAAYIINNSTSYDVGMNTRYMSTSDNLYLLPVFIGNIRIRYSSSSISGSSSETTIAGTSIFNNVVRNSTGNYTINTILPSSKYTTSKIMPIVSIYDGASNSVNDTTCTKIIYSTSGGYIAFTISLKNGTTYTDSSCILALWYLP